MLRKITALGVAGLIFVMIAGCVKKEKAKKISLEKREAVKVELSKVKPIRIAIGSIITPKEGFAYYKNLLDYIGEKLDMPVKIVDKESYGEINKLMGLGSIDVAFISSRPYVDGYDDYKIQLLAAPQINGKTVYNMYIIVAKNSPIKNLEGLRGKSFAFVDPMSDTGKLVPHYMLVERGENLDNYFRKYIYTYAHDKSIKMVAQGIVDGAAVSSVVWEYMNDISPLLAAKTKIIEKSPPYGMPPVVVRPGLKPELKKKLKDIFLNLHKDEKGREIIRKMKIDKYVQIDNSAYDDIREMRLWIVD